MRWYDLLRKVDRKLWPCLSLKGFSSVQSLGCVRLLVNPWTAAHQASLSITNSRSPPKPMSIESMMPSNHLILCCPLLLLPSIFPSIRVFSNESALCIRWPKYWTFSFSISPSNEHPGLISFSMDWLGLLAVQGTFKSLLQHHSSKASIFRCSAFFIVQLSVSTKGVRGWWWCDLYSSSFIVAGLYSRSMMTVTTASLWCAPQGRSWWKKHPNLLFRECRKVVSNSFATPWILAHQAPLFTGFPRQDFWSGLPFPSPGELPDTGIERTSNRTCTEPPGKPTLPSL